MFEVRLTNVSKFNSILIWLKSPYFYNYIFIVHINIASNCKRQKTIFSRALSNLKKSAYLCHKINSHCWKYQHLWTQWGAIPSLSESKALKAIREKNNPHFCETNSQIACQPLLHSEVRCEWHLTPNRSIVRQAGRFNSRRRGLDFEKFLPAAAARAGPMRQTNTHPAAPNKKKLMHCVT